MTKALQVQITVRAIVTDPVALYRFAAEIAKSDARAGERIGTEVCPDIEACARLALLHDAFAPGLELRGERGR